MKQITIFTTTYNRGYCLSQLYESLVKQTNKFFYWLIIDDGSSDNTRELVELWKNENKIEIQYKYKENGGMHTGHNLAYEIIETELNVCIDSDDFMPIDAIEKILTFWKKNKNKNIAGILGLDSFKNGNIVSNKQFPTNIKKGKYFELKGKYGLKGDIKFVFRTDVIKEYGPYPVFNNEKFVPLNYKYLLVDQDYDMLFLNEVLCVVEYLEDGSTRNIFKQYKNNPKGFIEERLVRMKYSYTLKERFANCIHYVSCNIFTLNLNLFKRTTNVLWTIIAFPFGVLLNLYINWKLLIRNK